MYFAYPQFDFSIYIPKLPRDRNAAGNSVIIYGNGEKLIQSPER